MAETDELDLDVNGEAGAQAAGGKKWLVVTALILLLLTGAGVGAYVFLGGAPADGEDAQETASERPLVFRTVEPELLGNIEGSGRVRYVQIGLVLAARDEKLLESVDRHMPVVRNDLLMLLSSKTYDDLITTEGREAARSEMLEAIRQVMLRNTGEPVVEAIYFNSFVMQ